MKYGSIPTGPSELYLQLLKGEISPQDYAKRTKKRLRDEARERLKVKRTATQRQRAIRR